MKYELWGTGYDGGKERLRAEEEAFLNDHDGDRKLERARWTLLTLSKKHRTSVEAVRNALLYAHIRLEARRIAEDSGRLQELTAYVTRSDIPLDETDYMSMTPAEFRACEQRLREEARWRLG